MAFPNLHAFPSDLPLWLLDGHQLRAGERVVPVPFEQGEDRHREIRTVSPWLATVGTKWLTQAQFDRFAAWFADELEAGVRRFDCPVHSLAGAGVQWWEAQFLGPYRWEARRARLRITADLMLLDGPYAGGFGPGTPGDTRVAPSLSARGVLETGGRGTFTTPSMQARGVLETDGRAIVSTSLSGRGVLETDGEARIGELVSLRLLDGAIGYRLLEGDQSGRRRLDP